MLVQTNRGQQAAETINFILENCCNCGIPFMMPKYHYDRLQRNKGESFYCPNGHGMHYSGPTEAQKLKRQLEKLEADKAKMEEDLQNKWLDALGEKSKLEKQLKRVHKGVCPCCNRTFQNLQKHMATKHPELTKKEEKK